MALERTIPKPASALVDRAGLPTREWYSFLQQLASQATSATLQAEIEALAARVLALEDSGQSVATILGLGSVLASGSLADGQVVLTLEGDSEAPGGSYYYGTGTDAAKGFFPLSDALAAGTNVTLDTDPDTGVTTINATGAKPVVERSLGIQYLGVDEIGKWIEYNPSGNGTIVVRCGQLEVGDEISVSQRSAGAVDFAAARPVTAALTHLHEATSLGQYAVIHIKKVANDEIRLWGDLGGTAPTFYILDELGNRQTDESGNLLTWV